VLSERLSVICVIRPARSSRKRGLSLFSLFSRRGRAENGACPYFPQYQYQSVGDGVEYPISLKTVLNGGQLVSHVSVTNIELNKPISRNNAMVFSH